MMPIYNSISLTMILGSGSSSSDWRFIDNSTGLWPLAAIAVLLAYYIVVRRLTLGVRARGTIVPRYEPPDNISPAMLRFLQRGAFDERAFAAAVLDLAARGWMEITGGQTKPYVFTRRQDDDASLPADEIALASALFHDGPVLRVDLGHAGLIARVKQMMAQCMESLAAPYFHSNRRFVAGGVVLSFAALLPLIAHMPLRGFVLLACAALAIFGGLITTACISAVRDIRHSLQRRSALGIFMALTGSAEIAAPLVLACACGLVILLLARFVSIVFGIFLAAAMVINIVAFCRRKVLNRRGRQLLDEAKGFREFLATAEAAQLNRTSEGLRAPEMIGRILPYALAFDLEHRWASLRFAHAFGFAGGEYVSSTHTEPGTLLPQGTKLPNPFDLLSVATFLMEAAPGMNDPLASSTDMSNENT